MRPKKHRGLTASALASAFVIAAALASGSACKSKSKQPTHRDAAPPPIDAAVPQIPGKVYFAVSREGVVELAGGEFRQVIKSEGRIDDLAVVKDGDVFAVADAQIVVSTADGGEPVGDRREPGLVRRIAAAADGTLWALGVKGLWRFADGAWTRDETFPRPRTVVDVAANRTEVVAAARDTAYILNGTEWVAVPLPEPPPPVKTPKRDAGPPSAVASAINDGDDDDGVGDLGDDGGDDGVDEDSGKAGARRTTVRELVAGADDSIYASTSQGIFKLRGTSWVEVSKTPVSALSVARDGTLVAAAESGGILFGKPGSFQERELATFGLAATELDAIATDSLGRIWLASDGGLVLVNGTGEAIRAWSAGSNAALPGRVVSIHVEVAPTMLPPINERRFGSISGTIVGHGRLDPKKSALRIVELCARPDSLFRGSPCAEAAVRRAGTTDDKGRFEIADVPAGRYGFAVQKDDDWVIDLTVDCCTQLFEGESVDVGKISVGD